VTPALGADAADRDQVEILGSRIDRVLPAEAVARIEGWIANPGPRPRHVVVTGFHGMWVGYQDPGFQAIVNAADLFVPDGIAPIWLSRVRGEPLPTRLPGADLMRRVFERADRRGYGSYFYGDTDETLGALRERLGVRYPGHRIAGTWSPPFRALSPEEDAADVARINAARPDILWVGLGLPKQETWIHGHLDRLQVPVVVGVGAAFGFMSGQVSRVPAWIGDAGFEWVWRFLAEPRKLWRRDLIDGPRFIWYGMRESLAYRLRQTRLARFIEGRRE
jgi:N-acetylglucosaminyldiphosphoundecaprenol N-acetyl-beta-D-mannosaminyltransferase